MRPPSNPCRRSPSASRVMSWPVFSVGLAPPCGSQLDIPTAPQRCLRLALVPPWAFLAAIGQPQPRRSFPPPQAESPAHTFLLGKSRVSCAASKMELSFTAFPSPSPGAAAGDCRVDSVAPVTGACPRHGAPLPGSAPCQLYSSPPSKKAQGRSVPNNPGLRARVTGRRQFLTFFV